MNDNTLDRYPGLPVFMLLLNGLTTSFQEFGCLYRKHRDRDRIWVAHGTMLANGGDPENGENEPVEQVIINTENSHPETERLVTEGAILRLPGSSVADTLAGTAVDVAVADVLRRIGNGEFPGAETTMEEATADLSESSMIEHIAFQLWKELVWRGTKVMQGPEGARVDAYVHVAGQKPRKTQLRTLNNGRLFVGHGTGKKRLFNTTDIDDFVGHGMEWKGVPLAPGSRVDAVEFDTVAMSEMEKVRWGKHGLVSTTYHENGCPRRPWVDTAPSVRLGFDDVEHTSRRFVRVGNTDEWIEVVKGNQIMPPKKRPRFLPIQVASGGLAALEP